MNEEFTDLDPHVPYSSTLQVNYLANAQLKRDKDSTNLLSIFCENLNYRVNNIKIKSIFLIISSDGNRDHWTPKKKLANDERNIITISKIK